MEFPPQDAVRAVKHNFSRVFPEYQEFSGATSFKGRPGETVRNLTMTADNALRKPYSRRWATRHIARATYMTFRGFVSDWFVKEEASAGPLKSERKKQRHSQPTQRGGAAEEDDGA